MKNNHHSSVLSHIASQYRFATTNNREWQPHSYSAVDVAIARDIARLGRHAAMAAEIRRDLERSRASYR